MSNVIGIDDGPFVRGSPEPVLVVGTVFSRTRMDGLLTCRIQQDGDDATERITKMVTESKFLDHAQLLLLSGITFGGLNVVDVVALAKATGLPVLVVIRKKPNLDAMLRATDRVPHETRKRALLVRAGPIEAAGRLWVQRVGLDPDAAMRALEITTLYGHFPEALRVAHLVAGGLSTGHSHGRP